MRDATYWIERLHLAPHPEGGFYVETYRSPVTLPTEVLPADFVAPRSAATAIYFLLAGDDFSAFHRLRSDEVWHHYAGSPLTIHRIEPDGTLTQDRLGGDTDSGGFPQTTIPAGCWFAATVDDPASYALVGCTMAPGFSPADLELAGREALLRAFPRHRALIERLTRPERGD